ncbi:homocitrate synthase/isopropylmalate synthase family protein [Gaoshiqia sp. Z1-71]|uniref:homocitrate synthase/isopropylmalate synthase family protein n=1 Tax=Gaoshiqia hydrogeniformans TaxID=3290090 RepID=UPI003BF81C04
MNNLTYQRASLLPSVGGLGEGSSSFPPPSEGLREAILIDSTLRDGEQAPGVVFSMEEKMKIAALLDECRVPEVEVGTPAMGDNELRIIREIVRAGFRFDKLCWARATEADIRASAKTGAGRISISFPVSDIQLSAMGRNREWVMRQIGPMISLARSEFGFVAVGAQDASRADRAFLNEFIAACLAKGANRIRLADTVGVLNPLTTANLLISVRSLFPFADFEFHGHNDLGMATANSFTALMSGAGSVSATVNGLGERAGNTCLEELAVALDLSSANKTGIRLPALQQLCHFVAEASGRPTPPAKPITGKLVCSHESGIHARSLLHDELSYQPFLSEKIGRKTELVIGKHSGKAMISDFFRKKKIALSEAESQVLTLRAKELSVGKKRALNEEELVLLAKSVKTK